MKKKIVILIIICFIFILIGCNNKNQGEIKFSNLTQKEESLLKLIENEADCKIYDYVVISISYFNLNNLYFIILLTISKTTNNTIRISPLIIPNSKSIPKIIVTIPKIE